MTSSRGPERPIHSETELVERLGEFEDWDFTLSQLLLVRLSEYREGMNKAADQIRDLVGKMKRLADDGDRVSQEVEQLHAENDRLRAKLAGVEGMGGLATLERAMRERDLLFSHAYGRVDWDDGDEEVMLLADRLAEEMGA